MKSFPRRFSDDVNYTSGPKSGNPTKVAMGSAASQGIIPGPAPNIGAEHMNDILHKLTELVRREWIKPFLQWQSLTFDFEPPSVAAVNEGTITRMSTGNDAAVFYHGAITNNDQLTADDNLHTGAVTDVIATPGYVYWIEPALSSTAIAREFDRSNLAAGSTSRSLTGSDSSTCRGAYDDVNDSVAIVQDGVNGYRSPPGGGDFSVATGSTLSSPDDDLRVAAGNGVIVAMANNTAMIRSTDGGATWVDDVTEISDVDRIHGLQWDPARERFIATIRTTSDQHKLYTSTDGTTWLLYDGLGDKGIADGTNDDYVTFLSGDVLMICPDSEASVEHFVVYDLGIGHSYKIGAPTKFTLAWGFDGVYLWASSTSVVHRSGAIEPLPVYDASGGLAEGVGA